MKRRRFIKAGAGAGLLLSTDWPSICSHLAEAPGPPRLSGTKARYYQKLQDNRIECLLCPRFCQPRDKERGACGVRENRGGTYISLVYGKPCSLNIDPIEKKPFFHFLPGTNAVSLGTAGCNANCKFCQNWQISQARPEDVESIDLPPAAVATLAEKKKCPSIAYTYTEPVVFVEYVIDSAEAAQAKGIRNVVVTNGQILRDPLRDLLKAVDAIKIDLKAFRRDFYREYVRGEFSTVLDSIRTSAESGTWLEIVYLVIPTLNDAPGEIREMSRWLRKEAGPDVPLHFSRFHPMYLIKNLPPTPVQTLETARDVALEEGMRFVYLGNVPGHESENTYCPNCRRPVIRRKGYEILSNDIRKGQCAFCGAAVPGVFAS